MRLSRWRQSVQRSSIMWIMRGDSLSVMARIMGISVRSARSPWRTAMPRSSRKARIWLITLVRWQTSRSRTRCSAWRSSWSTVLMATNFMVGRSTASAIASASRRSFFCPFEYGRTYRAGINRASWLGHDARLHADEAGRHVREPSLDLAARKLLAQNNRASPVEADEVERVLADVDADLAARKLLAQNNRASPVEADEVERVLADVDADCGNGFKATAVVWHGMLLILVAPNQLCGWLGHEHGGSIPLADIGPHLMLHQRRPLPESCIGPIRCP